jgi:DNA-binding Xre family transcriptional regulator
MDILNAVPLAVIISIYPVYHEMDITHFTEYMDKQMKKATSDTRLRTKRLNSGLSQSQLAAESGVSIRQIQLFEQRKRDINNTAAITLLRLSRALHCRMEDLIEYL